MKHLGQTIRGIRTAKGMSLSRLAAATGITKSTMSQMETSEDANPTIDTLIKIAGALGISIGNLIDGNFNPDEDERMLLKRFNRLSKRDKMIINGMITLLGG